MKSRSFNLLIILALFLSMLGSAVTVTPAYALSDIPLPNMPTANAAVMVIVPDGAGGVYIGGWFTQLTPAVGPAVTRNHVAHINADGSIDAAWDPNADSNVFSLAVSGGTVYVGGDFTTIGGQARNRIAALDATTGAATAWNPNADKSVRALAVSGGTVYAGGFFTTIGGQVRNHIAALDATTGNATAWNPNANNTIVYALAVSGSTVYAGGDFTIIGGEARNYIAALDAATGLVTAWNPNADNTVWTLAVSGGTVYAGGVFTTIGGQARNRIAALDASGNATVWNPNANNVVYALAVSGDTVYAGGIFNTIGGQARNLIAALDASGNATVWNPNVGGPVYTLAVSGSALYAGGTFPTIGGNSRQRFAAFSLDSTPPTVTNQSLQASYTGTGPSTFTVTFSEDVNNPAGDTSADDVTNPANYLLIEKGANKTADTASCLGGVKTDDTKVSVASVTYTNPTAIVNLASPLSAGNYRLFICGTTSILDLVGNHLNNGVDTTFDFTVTTSVSSSSSSGTSRFRLPGTGFAPSTVTSLPEQPADLAYTELGDLWLEIPSLNLKTNIVGVPLGEKNVWDVKWLGMDAGWLNDTAFPTWTGNSVITGHVYGADGLPGIFVNLKDLRKGDQVIVHMGGEKYIFEVQKSKLVRPDTTDFAFEHLEKNSYLTLITCSGYNEQNGSYRFRRVVRAVLVDVQKE